MSRPRCSLGPVRGISSRQHCCLTGLPFPGPGERFPTEAQTQFLPLIKPSVNRAARELVQWAAEGPENCLLAGSREDGQDRLVSTQCGAQDGAANAAASVCSPPSPEPVPTSRARPGPDVVRPSRVTEPLPRVEADSSRQDEEACGYTCAWMAQPTRSPATLGGSGIGCPVHTGDQNKKRCHLGSEDVHACLCHAGVLLVS